MRLREGMMEDKRRAQVGKSKMRAPSLQFKLSCKGAKSEVIPITR